jgi:ATP-binding cassette subfamily B protein
MYNVRRLPDSLLPFFWYFIKQTPFKFLIMTIAALAWAVQESLYPYFVKIIINEISLYSGDKNLLLQALSLTLIKCLMVGISIEAGFRLYDYMAMKIFPGLCASIRQHAFDYVELHSISYFSDNPPGALATRIFRLADATKDILELVASVFLPIIASFIISAILLWQSKPVFAVIILAWFTIHIYLTALLSKRSQNYTMKHSKVLSILNGKIVDSLSNIANVRLFARYNFERHYIGKYQNDEIKAARSSMLYSNFMKFCLGFTTIIFFFSLVTGAIYYYQKGLISLGDLMLVLSYQNLIGLIWYIGMHMVDVNELIGVCEEALKVINQPTEIVDHSNASTLRLSSGRIEFKNVTFNYARNNNIFDKVNLVIEPKQKIGLVGFSGSGKTTFVNLILRYFELSSGSILIDSQDIKSVTQESLRHSISLIPQDSSLFNRTVMQNIKYGRLDATDEEAYEAARLAHADEFITKLHEGYNTMVGERGNRLSGGQRQRITIARAMLKNSPILILDEATSAVDPLSERYIKDGLDILMQDKTVLVIAHRLSTLLDMDRILVFDRGHIIEDGTHQELLSQKGHYSKLWQLQSDGFLPNENDIE